MKKMLLLFILLLCAGVLFFNCPAETEDTGGGSTGGGTTVSSGGSSSESSSELSSSESSSSEPGSSSSSSVTFSAGASTSTGTLSNPITIVGVPGVTSAQGGVTLQGRTVYLSDFWIAETELTYAQWSEVYIWATANGYTFANAGYIGSSKSGSTLQPVTTINWRDAIVWCNALSEKESLIPCYTYTGSVIKDSRDTNATACDNAVLTLSNSGYRLSTEAEWEYAARGGYDAATYPNAPWNYTYSGSNTIGNVAWYASNSGGTTHNVGVNKVSEVNSANALGLYDMSGNVLEWCYDWYGSIGTTAETDPKGAASGCSNRVFRGGSYSGSGYYSGVVYRDYIPPYYEGASLGFRPVRSNP